MSAFGKVLGATFAIVLVSKVGLTVAFHADERHAEQAQNIVDKINNNTSDLAEPFSRLVAEKGVDTADIVLNYTLKPGFVENVKQMAEDEVRQKAIKGQDSLQQFIDEGSFVIVKFRNESGQVVKNVTLNKSHQG